jgi:hypothetical protein
LQATSNTRFFGRYFFSNYSHDPGFDATSNPNLLYASGNGLGIKSTVNTFAGGWDQVLSSSLFSATRVSVAKTTALRIQGNGLPTFALLGVNTYQYTTGDGQNFFNGATGGWTGNGFPGTFYTRPRRSRRTSTGPKVRTRCRSAAYGRGRSSTATVRSKRTA